LLGGGQLSVRLQGVTAHPMFECLPPPSHTHCVSPAVACVRLVVESQAGQYSDPGAGACTDCPAGQYSMASGRSSCLPCSAGYSCPAGSRNSTAVPCPAGTFSVGSAGACTVCPPGTPFSQSLANTTAACVASCPLPGCVHPWGVSVCPRGEIAVPWRVWYDDAGVEGNNSCLAPSFNPANVNGSAALCAALGGNLLSSYQVTAGCFVRSLVVAGTSLRFCAETRSPLPTPLPLECALVVAWLDPKPFPWCPRRPPSHRSPAPPGCYPSRRPYSRARTPPCL
jgi:hypothetical protein